MRVPLNVRLSSPTVERHITRDLRDLTFRSSIPGGYASATFSLSRPIDVRQDDLQPFTKAVVYDGVTGEVVWEGRLEDPGRGAGSSGQVWSLSAIGPSGHAKDRRVPLVYVDRSWAAWVRQTAPTNVASGTFDVTDDNADNAQARLQMPPNVTIPTGGYVNIKYPAIVECGQTTAVFGYAWDGGTSADLRVRGIVGATTIRDQLLSSAGAGYAQATSTTSFPAGSQTPQLRLVRTAANVNFGDNDLLWVDLKEMGVTATRYDSAGVLQTSGYTRVSVLASEVVEDQIGRLLPLYDPQDVRTTSFLIDQLTYLDGITPAEVFDDMMMLEPSFYWAAWERLSASGKYRFEWRPWPTSVGLEASVVDGFDAPGSAADLYNKVVVRWVDSRGRKRVTERTQSVPLLDEQGITRQAEIDLGSELGFPTSAIRAGDGFLADHRFASNGGNLTVARPIMDLAKGRMVQPWEIRPGVLVRVRGVESTPDALNASDRDGLTVFRVVETDYSSADNTCRLSLDAPARSGRWSQALMSRNAQARRRPGA